MKLYNLNMNEHKYKPNYAFGVTLKTVQTEATDSSSDGESSLVNVKNLKLLVKVHCHWVYW